MPAIFEDGRPYLDAFARFAREQPGNGRAWAGLLRKEGIERFEQLGFPTQKDEAWRCTSVAPLTRIPFALAEGGRTEGLTADVLERLTFEPWECTHLVFINGHFAPGLSRLRPFPAGVVVEPLAAALAARRDEIEPHLARHADDRTHAFAALNTAFMQDGALILVPDGAMIEEPLQVRQNANAPV